MTYFQVQDKKFRMKKVRYNLVLSIAIRLIESCLSTKISKRKKSITFPFEAQIAIYFFAVFKGHYKLTLGGVFRERRVLLVPPIVDLEFLYPKLSQIFYWCYSLKKLKIWCCRSCNHNKIIHS